jgi:hypothetical protein
MPKCIEATPQVRDLKPEFSNPTFLNSLLS